MSGLHLILALGGSAIGLLLLAWQVRRVVMSISSSARFQDDTAPGWILECPHCGYWRPAGETGITRMYAAGEKRQLGRCTTCTKLRWVKLRRSPGPVGLRRIDHRTNPEIWPDTLDG